MTPSAPAMRLLTALSSSLLPAAVLLTTACSSGSKESGTDAGPPRPADAGPVGATCTQSTDCTEGAKPACLTADAGFSNGYCASECAADGGCPSNAACVGGLFVGDDGGGASVCLQSCMSTSDCRSGYNCLESGDQHYCWPFCQSDDDCPWASDTCDTTTGLCSSPTPTAPDAGPVPDGGSVTSVPLTGCALVGYAAEVKIGGSQTFSMSIDTGSTTTAVAASNCTNCMGVSPEYTPGATAADTGQTNSSHYGSGSWDGVVYEDTIQVVPEMPAVPLYFAAITSQQEFFLDSTCNGGMGQTVEGILGLGPLDLDTIGMIAGDAYFTELVQSASIPDLFAVQLCSQGNGTLWFGGFDSSILTSPPQYTPIVPVNATSQPFYAVTLSDVGLGGTSLGATDYGPSIVDTGTYGFLMPNDAYNTLVMRLSSDSAVTNIFGTGMNASNADFFNMGNCATPGANQSAAEIDAALPPLSMTFPTAEGGSFTIEMPATSSYLIPVPNAMGNNGMTCYFPGVAGGGGLGETIIGASVQASHVTIFDSEHNRIGFATATGCQ